VSRADLIQIAYLVAAVCFILGLKWLSSPRSARRGNQVAAVGMAIAIVATLIDSRVVDYAWIVIAAVVGGSIGAVIARRVQMTAMPQLVALLNGLGGGAAALIAQEHVVRDEVVDYADLGMEAVRRIEVCDLPAFVLVDDKGNQLMP
jgi:NAD(P) transhydrogenase subunit beta